MRAAVLLAVLLLLPTATAQPVLHAVVPDLPGPGPGDEGVAVVSATAMDLRGHRLDDGEGAWTFPAGSWLEPGEPLWIVGDRATWSTFTDEAALEWNATGLALANSGDDVCLVSPAGVDLDCFSWGPEGAVGYRSPGALYARGDGSWVTPRIHRVGESELSQPTFQVAAVTAYASPDHTLQVLSGLIQGAQKRLHLHVYALGHVALVDTLADAMEARPSLDVRILVDGRVVGRSATETAETAWHLQRLQEAGAQVVVAEGGRYVHHHLKVLVADDAVAVQSENWVETGVPGDPTWGNRGWGVVVHDPGFAAWIAQWMADDRAAWDVRPGAPPVPPGAPRPLHISPPVGAHAPSAFGGRLDGPFNVTAVIAPDHTADPRTDPLLSALDAASERIWTQQLRMDIREGNRLGWEAPDRYALALAEAAGRGVDVRVMLQGPFGRSDDNAEASAWLEAHGVAVQRPDLPGIVTLHNKGWIIDDAVVVGSMNGHHASRSQNREVSLLVEGAAEPYVDWFLADWRHGEHGLPATQLPILLALLGLAAVLRRRT